MAAHVVVAMSGGVDSSVAAALLVRQGYQVTGMMMRLWSESGKMQDNRCCSPEAMALARRVSAILGIPFYTLDAQQEFYDQVVQPFITGYTQGITPNPCLFCNREVRWNYLLGHALGMGAEFLATGHYARIVQSPDRPIELHQSIDSNKDQSYILHVLTQEKLQHAKFPLGEYTKPQVRQIAREMGLPVADRPESQDLCFLGDEDYRTFLEHHAPNPFETGPIYNVQGELLGTHPGLPFFTIGQRKGLGISNTRPVYVIEKDTSRNALIVGLKEELGRTEFWGNSFNWISGEHPTTSFTADVKIRYKAQPARAIIVPLDKNLVRFELAHPLIDITPGQAAVIYHGDRCLGGGIIQLSAS